MLRFDDFLNEEFSVKDRNGVKVTADQIKDMLKTFPKTVMNRKEILDALTDHLNILMTKSAEAKFIEFGILTKTGDRGKYIITLDDDGKETPKNTTPVNKDDLDGDGISDEIMNAEVGDGKAKTLKQVSAKTSVKYRVPTSSKGDKFGKFVESVLMNMINTSKGLEKGSLLLKGDPGTGKTSAIQQFAGLMGMNIYTIEAPHVSEDSIISVPYLIRKGNDVERKVSEFKEIEGGFEVINAESSLISELKKKVPMKDTTWNQFITANKHLSPIRDSYRRPIDKIREVYNSILFIDELYRVGSPRLQNLFRTILNGNLGGTPIPKNVYIIFASNMDNSDGSLDDIPLNHQFSAVDFDKPSKNDFMAYIASAYTNADLTTGEHTDDSEMVVSKKDTNNQSLAIDPDVYNAFEDTLTNDDLGGKDVATDIRISPRRWEEIIKYVNANIPPKDAVAAKALVHFIYTNMRNYETKEYSEITQKYVKMVKELIKEKSGIDVDSVVAPRADEWEDSFASQIETKMKLGGDRRYVASLSGLPGVGKTTSIRNLGDKLGLKVIEIDCSTLNSDDVVGLTTPEGEGASITTKFSEPPLYKRIMKNYEPDRVVEGSAYTHILFLDEITRASKRVMNSIRSLMLEKKVNANYEIPKNMMIITALNPTDVGAESLSDHMKDVMDIIDVEMRVQTLFDYLGTKKENTHPLYDWTMSEEENKAAGHTLGFNLVSVIIGIIQNLMETMASKVNTDGEPISGNTRNFFWEFNNNVIYVSPREIDDMVTGSVGMIATRLVEFEGFNANERYDDSDYEYFINVMKDTAKEKINSILSFIAKDKHQISEEDTDALFGLVSAEVERSTDNFDSMRTIKSQNVTSLKAMVEATGFDIEQMLAYPETHSLIETYIESVEVEEFIINVGSVIDDIFMNYKENIDDFTTKIFGLYTLLTTVQWEKYTNELTSTTSEVMISRALKPFAKHLEQLILTDDSMDFNEFTDNHKYGKTMSVASYRGRVNRVNMFIPVAGEPSL